MNWFSRKKTWLGALMVAASALGVCASTAWADPPPSPEVAELRVVIVTGDDDLRRDSTAVARLEFNDRSGRRLTISRDLNARNEWPNWSTNTRTMPVPDGVTLANLDSFAIEFTSGQPDVFHTGDNWNLQSIEVWATLDDAEGTQVLVTSDANDPLHRFKSDRDRVWRTLL
ncbi:MAG: hypothetical protein H6721_23085 [Sandaracinus sp.]|nr:hypothetical protein [Sandaracinus sp.]MCB9617077.1 hypothetical protein [Sandaracinus sp.]MCB9635020.1 hypothetical protein [Sandaracinus sp.]